MIRLRRAPAVGVPAPVGVLPAIKSEETPVVPPQSPRMECPICLSATVQKKLDCEHEFCTACYDRLAPGSNGDWSLLPTCPLCRAPHLAVHPSVPADEAEVALNSIRSIKLPESTLAELGKAKGAYLGQLLKNLEDTKRRIEDATTMLVHMNRFSQPAIGGTILSGIDYVATMTLVLPTFSQLYGTPLIPDAYWSGSTGFRFQYLESAPQVVNSAHVTENVLRRADSPNLAHLNDGMLAMYRFGLLAPAAVGALARGERVPLAVQNMSKLLVWYLTQGFFTRYVDEFSVDMESISSFYGDVANSRSWYIEHTEGTLLNELKLLYSWASMRHLDALRLRRTVSRENHNAYYMRYNALWTHVSVPSMGHFPELSSAKKCAGCEHYAPLSAFYSARRGTEPRRVRCEGCSPRHVHIQAWA